MNKNENEGRYGHGARGRHTYGGEDAQQLSGDLDSGPGSPRTQFVIGQNHFTSLGPTQLTHI